MALRCKRAGGMGTGRSGAEGIRAPNGLALSDDGRTLAWNVAYGTVLFLR